jgi:hypothetical protein
MFCIRAYDQILKAFHAYFFLKKSHFIMQNGYRNQFIIIN